MSPLCSGAKSQWFIRVVDEDMMGVGRLSLSSRGWESAKRAGLAPGRPTEGQIQLGFRLTSSMCYIVRSLRKVPQRGWSQRLELLGTWGSQKPSDQRSRPRCDPLDPCHCTAASPTCPMRGGGALNFISS